MVVEYDDHNLVDYGTIIETKNVEFFKHIYPLSDKISHATKTLNAPLLNLEKTDEVLRKLIVILNHILKQ